MTDSAPRRGRRRGDLIASIVLLLLLGVACTAATYVGVVLSVLPATCDTSNITCDFDAIDSGFTIAFVTPTLVTIIAVAITIATWLRGRRSFWIPLVGIGLCVAAAVTGSLLVVGAVPGVELY